MINKMKRVNLFFIAAFVAASSMLVVSCEDDDDPDNAPTIKVMAKVGNGNQVIYTENTELTNDEGTSLCFDVTVTMGKSKVNLITVASNRFNKPLVDIDKSSWLSASIDTWTMSTDEADYGEYCTSVGNDNEILTFQATDKKNRVAEIKITLTKRKPADQGGTSGEISYYLVPGSFGCQGHLTNPSFYSVTNGSAMMLSGAKNNPANVDFVFYNKSGVKVGCPSGEVKDVAFSGSSTIATLLTIKNSLKFHETTKGDAATGKYTNDWWTAATTAVGTATTTELPLTVDKVIFYQKVTTDKTYTGAFLVRTVGAAANTASITVDFIVKQQ